MCSIIGFKASRSKLDSILENEKVIKLFNTTLNSKGGDEYKVVVTVRGFHKEYPFTDITRLFKDLSFEFKLFGSDTQIGLLFFSRLTPEMEAQTKSLQQPYMNQTINGWVAVHGTIPLAEDFKSINVDTEIFGTGDLQDSIDYTEKVGGKIAMLSMEYKEKERTLVFNSYENGLGMYRYQINLPKDAQFEFYSNINIPLEDGFIWRIQSPRNFYNPNPKAKVRVISLFSGGLDITCSTLSVLDDYKFSIDTVDVWYFDWGTRAASSEIMAGKLFREKLVELGTKEDTIIQSLKDDDINYEIIPIHTMFDNILKACDTTVRLNSKDAEGAGSHEAEAALSYVPFRNQFLLTLAAAKAEQLYPGDHCVFVLGANLSEGMVYLDNSETFVNLMNKVVTVGGQKCYNFSVRAPFVNRTKTDMVKTCLNKGYDLSTVYSCYFPKEDGSKCGTCGSCLLQENALKRGKELSDVD